MKSSMHNIGFRLKAGLHVVKSAVVVTFVFLSIPSAWAQFTWPVYEPFGEYTNDNEDLGSGDTLTYWNVGNGGTNGVQSYIVSSAAAMSFPALVGDPNPTPKGVMSVYINNTSADRGFLFTTNTLSSGAIYASFLLNYIDNGVGITGYSQNRCMFNIVTGATDYTGGSYGAIYSSVWLTPDYRIEIDKNYQQGGAFTSPSPVIATNVPHLIVVRYKVVTGGNDEMDLWIDPMPFGNDGSIPPPTLTTTNGANIANFNALMLNSRKTPNYTATAFYVDEIRLGDTWSSVTPLVTPAPGPLFAVTGGGTACPDTTLDVALSGSVSSNVYLLYTNNTYAGVALTGSGSALDFGQQSAAGVYSVLASNIVTANIGWMSNSATITLIPPPVIVAEPSPVVTATNNRAEFYVGLTGTGFSYQWYQDGTPLSNNTNITGALTNDLVIWPATAANIGNYYCVVSNTCGESSTTTTNSLTLDAPNNLVWAGDAFSINLWAVGATSVPEFTDPSSNPVYFNEGDNVTFNDTYNGAQYGTNITLTNILTPTSITYDTAQELTWAGPGSIAGSGSLLVNGSGVLKLLNNSAGKYANTYTGGTVISNGTVNMPNSWTGLGTGPLTLAGGTLETDQKSSGTGSSVGLPQNLYVTANSTWQVDKTGNQCAGLAGALLGNPGTTLTISNSANDNHQEEIRFNGVFTNNCAIVTAVNPLTTNQSMQIGSFNSSGVQVYNGAISGPTAAFFVSGAGAVYLNGANTYTNTTTVSAGFLAGSGSINGPLTVSSGGTLGGGPANAIGTFTVNGNVNLSGKLLIRVDKSLVQSNDFISVTGTITNGGTGTVTITNSGATPLAAGDRFQIFSGPIENGAALAVTGGGVTWANNLAVDGSVHVSLGFVVLTNSPLITSFSPQGANAVINGSNGQVGATAYLLMTTNIAQPPNQWKTVATNVLGGSAYTFVGTNVITASSPQQFFMLSSTNYNP
ncbi:MAG TPA: immunoglobulin domain-containing protein [Verrucomicrobiae bacterium]|nr:immunoglobulin domain-containing protein [Verrucomicrobiae bacterium]